MEKSVIVADKVAKPSGPYSHGTRVSLSGADLIFASGQVSLDAKGNTVGKGDIVLQTEQVLRNLQSVLEASGTSLAHVVKVTVFYEIWSTGMLLLKFVSVSLRITYRQVL